MVALTPAHDAVLALVDWLPADRDVDAALVAELLRIPKIGPTNGVFALRAYQPLACRVYPPAAAP
jgi:hypothetical protein